MAESGESTANSALFIVSDVVDSVQVEEYVDCLNIVYPKVTILFQGSSTATIIRNIRAKNYSTVRVEVFETRDFISHLKLIVCQIGDRLRDRSDIFFSGSQSTTILACIAWTLRQRVIIFRHYANYHRLHGLKKGLVKDSIISRLATLIVCASETTREFLIEEGVNPNKLNLVHYYVDQEPYLNLWNEKVFEERKLDGVFRVGVISRLSKSKGIINIIHACEQALYKHGIRIELEILGAPSDDIDLLNSIERGCWPFVKWQKHVSEPAKHLVNWDLFVHAPVSRAAEAFGIVYVESLASGIPCVFTRAGITSELPELIEGATFVAFRKVEPILQAIITLKEKNTFIHRHWDARLFSKQEMRKELMHCLKKLSDGSNDEY